MGVAIMGREARMQEGAGAEIFASRILAVVTWKPAWREKRAAL